ncbi:transforming growth factor beta activator LRRC33-like [Podarcis muralis]
MGFLQVHLLFWVLLPAFLRAWPRQMETPKLLPCWKTWISVSCRGRGLTTFPQGLSYEIKRIDLSHNAISNLTDHDTSALEQLEQLDLSYNHLRSLSGGALGHLAHLRSLILAGNQLHRDHFSNGNAFLSLVSLAALDVSANGLDNQMVASYLHHLPVLEWLDLSGNHLTCLANGIFQGVPRLRELHLRRNSLVEIEEGALSQLRALEVLDLSMNSLHCITGFGLAQLRVLNLSYNALESFDGAGEEAPCRLHVLDLSHNWLNALPLLPRRNRLRYLNLSHNAITTATNESQNVTPQNVSQSFAKLMDLNLSRNRLGSFPVALLHGLASLRALSLARNCLSDFAVELPTNHSSPGPIADRAWQKQTSLSVRMLDLQGNSISHLPPRFFDLLPDLEVMDLGLNRIQLCQARNSSKGECLHAKTEDCTTFHCLPHLRHLSLRGNNLRLVHGCLFHQTPLASLDLSENQGLVLPSYALEGLEASLQELSLRGNRMKTASLNFPCLVSLSILDMSGNDLSAVPPSLLCSPLEKLDIQGNQLESIEEAAAKQLRRSLRALSVAGNPFSCCERKWLQILGTSVLDLGETLCYYRNGDESFTTQISGEQAGQLCPRNAYKVYLAVTAFLVCTVGLLCASVRWFLKRAKTCMPLCLGSLRNKVEPAPSPSKEANSTIL